MSPTVSIERDGAPAARRALERSVIAGGVVLFPADGLYGLACDPLNAQAIRRIHSLKGRDDGKPSAVLYFSQLVMRELLADVGERTARAMGALLPGPVTLVIANPGGRYRLACGDHPGRLGIRLLGGPLQGVRTPLFQTSANPSGEAAPATLDAVAPAIRAGVDVAVDGGELSGQPSTVVDLSDLDGGGGWRLLREGGLDAAELSRALATLDPP